MQQTWKDKERVLSLLGSVCSGHCGYYWGQYHAELAPRPSDARTTLSECGNSHFCFLFLILIQSFCAKVALAANSVLGFLVDFNFNWSVTLKVVESEQSKICLMTTRAGLKLLQKQNNTFRVTLSKADRGPQNLEPINWRPPSIRSNELTGLPKGWMTRTRQEAANRIVILSESSRCYIVPRSRCEHFNWTESCLLRSHRIRTMRVAPERIVLVLNSCQNCLNIILSRGATTNNTSGVKIWLLSVRLYLGWGTFPRPDNKETCTAMCQVVPIVGVNPVTSLQIASPRPTHAAALRIPSRTKLRRELDLWKCWQPLRMGQVVNFDTCCEKSHPDPPPLLLPVSEIEPSLTGQEDIPTLRSNQTVSWTWN